MGTINSRKRSRKRNPSLALLLVIFCVWSPCSYCSAFNNNILKKAASFGKPPTGRLLEELVAVRGGGGSLQPLSLSPDAIALAENLAPKVGIVTSTLLYFTSAPAVLTAVKKEDMGDLNPLPLAIMSVVSVAWLAYGLSVRDKYVTLSNIAGAVGSIGYVVGILPLLAKDRAQLRLTQGVVLVGAAATLCLWTCLGLSGASSAKISATLGAFASGLFVILTASPLSTIKTVVSTKNSASILGPFTGGQVANTFLWSAYGLAIKDCFVWGPNMVGLGLGLVQLALKILFPSPKKAVAS